MPALGGFTPNSAFGGLRNEKPQIPQAFFTMESEEIVALLVGMGYSEKSARADVAKFMEYKARAEGPQQVFSDDDERPDEPLPEGAQSERFGGFVERLKGGNDGN